MTLFDLIPPDAAKVLLLWIADTTEMYNVAPAFEEDYLYIGDVGVWWSSSGGVWARLPGDYQLACLWGYGRSALTLDFDRVDAWLTKQYGPPRRARLRETYGLPNQPYRDPDPARRRVV